MCVKLPYHNPKKLQFMLITPVGYQKTIIFFANTPVVGFKTPNYKQQVSSCKQPVDLAENLVPVITFLGVSVHLRVIQFWGVNVTAKIMDLYWKTTICSHNIYIYMHILQSYESYIYTHHPFKFEIVNWAKKKPAVPSHRTGGAHPGVNGSPILGSSQKNRPFEVLKKYCIAG